MSAAAPGAAITVLPAPAAADPLTGRKPSPALIETLEADYGVTVSHVWGMTEMTLGVSGALTGRVKARAELRKPRRTS